METTKFLQKQDTWFQSSIASLFIDYSNLAATGKTITYEDITNSIDYYCYKKLQRTLRTSQLDIIIPYQHIPPNFLLAVPGWKDTNFSNDQFRITLKLKLLQTILPDHLELQCNCSKSTKVDSYGDHLLCSSNYNQNEWQYRHDLLVYGLAELAKDAGRFYNPQ